MTWVRRKSQKFLVALLATLGLCVSSVAACACSHHKEPEHPTESCHSTAPAPNQHHNESEPAAGLYVDETCVCSPAATRLSVKAEGFKLKKHPAVILSSLPGVGQLALRTVHTAATFEIERVIPRDSVRESASSRGPPQS
jgi:hypothetical protein